MTTNDGSRRIGEMHGQRDRAAAVGEQALVEREQRRHAAYLLRDRMERL